MSTKAFDKAHFYDDEVSILF